MLMFECVKCGHQNPEGGDACADCTWSFSVPAWHTTTFRIKRVTLDTSCINAKHRHQDLNAIERWDARGMLSIQRSQAMLDELTGPVRVAKARTIERHPELFQLGVSLLCGGDVLAGPDMGDDIQRILFPTTKSLTRNQQYDVEHLRLHVRTGGDAFLTLNTKDFIVRGKQQLAQHGIWAFTPAQFVVLVRKLYSWA